jgi:hypothetical protein
VDRNCDTCGHWFSAPAGSLRPNCREAACVKRRRELMMEARASAERALKRRITEVELLEATVRQARPELAVVAARVGQLDGCPEPRDLARAVRNAVKPAGSRALREALLDVAAVAVRWAAALPRDGEHLNPTFEKAQEEGVAA